MEPFALLGRRLQRDGHRVRLATHACYRELVVNKGLEFYPLAGDPHVLSEYMVRTNGCIIPQSTELWMEVSFFLEKIIIVILNIRFHFISLSLGK